MVNAWSLSDCIKRLLMLFVFDWNIQFGRSFLHLCVMHLNAEKLTSKNISSQKTYFFSIPISFSIVNPYSNPDFCHCCCSLSFVRCISHVFFPIELHLSTTTTLNIIHSTERQKTEFREEDWEDREKEKREIQIEMDREIEREIQCIES